MVCSAPAPTQRTRRPGGRGTRRGTLSVGSRRGCGAPAAPAAAVARCAVAEPPPGIAMAAAAVAMAPPGTVGAAPAGEGAKAVGASAALLSTWPAPLDACPTATATGAAPEAAGSAPTAAPGCPGAPARIACGAGVAAVVAVAAEVAATAVIARPAVGSEAAAGAVWYGTVRGSLTGSPSRPYLNSPHVQSSPPAVTKHEWRAPAATRTTLCPRRAGMGWGAGTVVGWYGPSSPPHRRTSPLSVRNREWYIPAASCAMGGSSASAPPRVWGGGRCAAPGQPDDCPAPNPTGLAGPAAAKGARRAAFATGVEAPGVKNPAVNESGDRRIFKVRHRPASRHRQHRHRRACVGGWEYRNSRRRCGQPANPLHPQLARQAGSPPPHVPARPAADYQRVEAARGDRECPLGQGDGPRRRPGHHPHRGIVHHPQLARRVLSAAVDLPGPKQEGGMQLPGRHLHHDPAIEERQAARGEDRHLGGWRAALPRARVAPREDLSRVSQRQRVSKPGGYGRDLCPAQAVDGGRDGRV
eukprot:scaffold4950_cov99-Isochrysis_galbana.AAC.6